MAELWLTTPEHFNFTKPDEWAKWKKRFKQYRQASNLSTDSELRQVNTLLYCMGDQVEEVLQSTNPTEEEWKKYDTVLQKFDDYFKVRKNTIYEMAQFNK